MQYDDIDPFEAINARITASVDIEQSSAERPRSPRPVRKSSMRARALLEAVARVPGIAPDEDVPREEPADPRDAPAGDGFDGAAPMHGGGGGADAELAAADAAGRRVPPRGCLIESWLPKQGSGAGRLDVFRVPSIQRSP